MRTLIKMKDCVEAGWMPIVERAIISIEDHGGYILDIKEKFGGLRIYTHGGDYECIKEIVKEAEEEADQTCEYCGGEGSLHNLGGWYKTVCKTCLEQKMKCA